MTAKKELAEAIVARYHDDTAARDARERFEATVQRREAPREMPEVVAAGWQTLADALVGSGFAASKREAERLVVGGGVKLDGIAATDPRGRWNATEPVVLSVGTRRFARLVPGPAGR